MLRWLVTVFIATAILSSCWPWLTRLGIGRLPGDVHLRWRGRSYLFPFASSIVLSLLINLAMRWL